MRLLSLRHSVLAEAGIAYSTPSERTEHYRFHSSVALASTCRSERQWLSDGITESIITLAVANLTVIARSSVFVTRGGTLARRRLHET